MQGLSSKAIEQIEQAISDSFKRTALSFLGNIPSIKKSKNIILEDGSINLSYLFVQAIENRKPTELEKDALKGILRIANNYIEGLESRTKAKITQSLNAYIGEAREKKDQVSTSKIREIIKTDLDWAGNQLKTIVNAESTKTKNIATAMQIEKVAASQGVYDPVVFYIVTHDHATAETPEKDIHTIKGTHIPRLWKLSEFSMDYWKKGDSVPSLMGGHPFCRCFLTFMATGFGFDGNGKVMYKDKDWDELKFQREKYGEPK
jgi:hypothetical protein